MFRDTSYAPSRGSFQTPVAPPLADPDAAPTHSISINCSWLPFVRGALEQLLLQATWKTDDPATLLLAQQRAWTLIAMFDECTGSTVPFACPFDFRLHPYDGVAANDDPDLTPAAQAVYAPGFGWVEQSMTQISTGFNLTRCRFHFDLPTPVQVLSATMTYDLFKGSPVPGGFGNSIYLYSGGVPVTGHSVPAGTDPDGTGKTLTVSVGSPTTIDQIYCQINTHYDNTGADGSCAVTNLEIQGVGFPPC